MEERESTSRKVRELALVWRTNLSECLTRNTGIDFDKSLFVVFGFRKLLSGETEVPARSTSVSQRHNSIQKGLRAQPPNLDPTTLEATVTTVSIPG
jgi:hypothetical protein